MPDQKVHADLAPILSVIDFLKRTQFKSTVSVNNFSIYVKKILKTHQGTISSSIQNKISTTLEGFEKKTLDQKKRAIEQIKYLCLQKQDSKPLSKSEKVIPKNLTIQVEQNLYSPQEHEAVDLKQWEKDYEKINKSVQYIKGVGPALAQKLKKVGVETLEDLLKFFPKKYEDRRHCIPIKDLKDGQLCFISAEVIFSGVAYYKGARKRVYEVIVKDGHDELKLKWFHFYEKQLSMQTKVGQTLFIYGHVKLYDKGFEMHHPDIEPQGRAVDQSSFGQIIPVYKDTACVYQKTLRKIILSTLTASSQHIKCMLPQDLCKALNLNHPKSSIEQLHYPNAILSEDEVYALQRVFVVEELFFYTLALLLRKKLSKKSIGIAKALPSSKKEKLINQLPYTLTEDQQSVLSEIINDMRSESAMNRLLQGDVGSGKTVVALLAALHAIDNGSQAVFLAPTEVLAVQHYDSLSKLLSSFDVRIEVLLGKQKKSEKKALIKRLKQGDIDLIIGTHAVLEENIVFKKLGLVIVDEQHRFGVHQRASIKDKGNSPDVLVMSATPIPRTLALTLYGDLDVSQIKQMPAGRKKTITKVFKDKQRQEVYTHIGRAVEQGQQAFIIYPLVEESEKIDLRDATSMAKYFKELIFPEYKVGLVHGKMKSDQKNEVMQQFKNHELDILVSTTVIEVGINIPNASTIVIEHPERFGLSQLHQLRGRVGRGDQQAQCFLLHPSAISENARKRLKIFATTTDGFKLAEEDLKNRGPGDFFGKEQSGFPNFQSALFPRDLALLERVRQYVIELLSKDPDLVNSENQYLSYIFEKQWRDRIKLFHIS